MDTVRVEVLRPTACDAGIVCPPDLAVLPALVAWRLASKGIVALVPVPIVPGKQIIGRIGKIGTGQVKGTIKIGRKMPRKSHGGKKWKKS